jgi:hypothetical protein
MIGSGVLTKYDDAPSSIGSDHEKDKFLLELPG